MYDLSRIAWFIQESDAIEGERSRSLWKTRKLLCERSSVGHVGAFLHLRSVVQEGDLPYWSDLLYAHELLIREFLDGVVRDDGTSPSSGRESLPMADIRQKVSAVRFGASDREAAVDLVADAHHAFLKARPFTDGDGRISRLYANALLLYFDLPPAVFTAGDCHGSYYPACRWKDGHLMRAYLRAKIAHPKCPLTLSSTNGWIESLPQKL